MADLSTVGRSSGFPPALLCLGIAACGGGDYYGAPPGAPYTAEEVVVRTPAGLSLSGTLTLPAGADGPVPAVVTITGSGRQDRDEHLMEGYRPFYQIADTLGRRGIATLRLDDRGVNDSDAGPAGAASSDFADDVRGAVGWLRSRPEVDAARIGLVGHSEGGAIAPMVAATDSIIAGVVLLAGPAYTLRRINDFQRQSAIDGMADLTPEERAAERRRSDLRADRRAREDPWFREAREYDPLPTARRVGAPVLILHGEADRRITPEQADTLAAAFREGGNADVTVRLFPDTNHFFVADETAGTGGVASLAPRPLRPDVLGAIADWLAARLR